MEWQSVVTQVGLSVLQIVGGGLVTWFLFLRQNKRKLKLEVQARGQFASIPLHPMERHAVQIIVTNVGQRSINVENCFFRIDGESKQIFIHRHNFVTFREGFPRTLEPDEKCCVSYPAEAFYGHDLSSVSVVDSQGKRWSAPTSAVRNAAREIATLRLEDAA